MNDLNVFGVRHLSPGASFHLRNYLDDIKPLCVLIEGPADSVEEMASLADSRIVPPVALMAYTSDLPIETILYPFAEYSPEFQAIRWAAENKAHTRFIDLPAAITLKLRQSRYSEKTGSKEQEDSDEQKEQADIKAQKRSDYNMFHNGLYDKLAKEWGEDEYESYWERTFEHNLNNNSYRLGINQQSGEMRNMVEGPELESSPYEYAYNLLREAHMKREIKKALEEYKPHEIVIIVGAYHVLGITNNLPALSDNELAKLPRTNAKMALMPYSYHRLSSRTGYGAGNKAPYYFELMWQCINNKELNKLPAIYLASVGAEMRRTGNNASSASVIEGVRLANALSSLRQGSLPVLADLHDAATACFGHGEISSVATAINMVDVGTAIGSVPEGLSQTPMQDDMTRQLKRLKLTNYKSMLPQEISLDLRENRTVKSEEAAYLDLNRSTFFHRLELLNIHFAQALNVSQSSATWAEKWNLQWTPEQEIELVETNLKGETVELAAAFELKERAELCSDVNQAAALVKTACECNLIDSFSNALNILQQLATDADSFKETAGAAHKLSVLLKYGDVRKFNLAPLVPLLDQLYIRASLLLYEASSCDDKAATTIAEAINIMDRIGQDNETLNTDLWLHELKKLAMNDDRNAKLSGTAFSLLLEHNVVSEDDCSKEVSRRLSAGVPADIGAAWFEGMSGRNRYALLSRIFLWKELDNYVQSLEKEEFYRSVVFLRRALGSFDANHKNSISELLGDIWGTGAEQTAEILSAELSETENEKLEELNNFEFDF